jgi:flagellar protein FlaF
MGFSVAASFTILLITTLIVSGMILSESIHKLKEARQVYIQEKKKAIEILTTEFQITSIAAYNTSPTTHTLTVTIENTGSTTLETSYFNVLVDGVLVDASYNVSYLYPGEYLRIDASGLSGGAGTTHRLKIVAENGVAEYGSYQVI